jgi:Ni,Fe-hydrogenase III small subunit/ferredoxin
MFKTIYARLKQKFRTIAFPDKEPSLPEKFQGLPNINYNKCNLCLECMHACPTGALFVEDKQIAIDLGKCLFCHKCALSCTPQAIRYTRDYRLATRKKEALIYQGDPIKLADAIKKELLKLFGKSLCLRQVSAGGCNGCELDINVLNTIVFDLSRFGIQFTASPRHADGLLVSGPVTKNMEEALKKSYEALSEPKIVIVVGACAISGGPYIGHDEVIGGADKIMPVDLYIPGCPPHPITILDGLLRLIDKRKGNT